MKGLHGNGRQVKGIHMGNILTRTLMDEFASRTGLEGTQLPRRYLWTDAFAVCNFLWLARHTGENRYRELARKLVDQVHHILGRHRDDDPRHGWISGLSEEEGENHPTAGGLRIGKAFNERGPHQPLNSELEWDRDGQYFHYLTKWMHALYRMGQETGESQYQHWATELAQTAHRAFVRERFRGGPKWIAWKMSIDLRRPLVNSMGQHDPLDGLITYLELQTIEEIEKKQSVDLTNAIADMTEMSESANWATEDPLGIGGLLDSATRLARLIFQHGVKRRELLRQLLDAADLSLQTLIRSSDLRRSVEHRLAFRELGLSIGIHGLRRLAQLVGNDRSLAAVADRLLRFQSLADQIEAFWCNPEHRLSRIWTEHQEIDSVMLATSLLFEGSPEGQYR